PSQSPRKEVTLLAHVDPPRTAGGRSLRPHTLSFLKRAWTDLCRRFLKSREPSPAAHRRKRAAPGGIIFGKGPGGGCLLLGSSHLFLVGRFRSRDRRLLLVGTDRSGPSPDGNDERLPADFSLGGLSVVRPYRAGLLRIRLGDDDAGDRLSLHLSL